MGKDTYTEMQLKIINGDIPLDKVGSNILARLRNKAILLNDQDLAQMIEVQLAQNKADSKARNLERAKKYYHETKEKGLSWQPAKTPVYSERQVKIIHNEIPYDSVTIRDLIAIRQKAVLNNDGVLADKMLDLITDKKAESAEKARLRNIERDRRLRENGTKGFSHKNKLNKEERGILSGHNDVSDYSLEHLYHIKEVCEKTNDNHNLEIINLLIQYVALRKNLCKFKNCDKNTLLSERLYSAAQIFYSIQWIL